jgi:DUF4097 and DUF4098 domain-containing protein YvlB
MPTFQTPTPIMATIDINAGDIRVVASGRTDTVVEIIPRNASDAAHVQAAAEARVEYSDGRLLVKSTKNWKQYLPFSSGALIDVLLEVPAGSRVEASTGFGKVRAEGRLGQCRLQSAMGDLSLDEAASATVHTSFGDIAVDRVAGGLNATSGSGEIRVGEVGGNAEIRNANGATTIGSVGGDLRARAANGSIAIETARNAVWAKTANGSIRIGAVERGTVEIETSVGELDVGIRPGTAAWLDARSQFGNVRSELDAIDQPQPADGTVEIRAHTSVGDIVIHRAAEAGASDQMTETVE